MDILDPAYKLKNTAALRARRLVQSMGQDMQMENDERYREAILGSKYRFPLSSVAEPPMKKLNQALARARDVEAAEQARKDKP